MLFKRFYTFVISFQIFSFQTILANEPVCSKFAYEEKLLEKMIRTEIKVEAMVNEIKVTQERVMDTLGVISKTVKDFTEKFEDLRKNNTAELLESSETIDKRIKIFENLNEEIRKNFTLETESQRNIIADLSGKLDRPNVVFYATHVADTSLAATSEVIVFDKIFTNEGSGYDTSTGKFTASIEGFYQFAVHLCTPISKYAYIEILHEGNKIARTYIYGVGQNAFCGSVGAIVKVKSGEQVWVHSYSGGSTRSLIEDDNRWNSFSGMLINT